jgi:hypothetical protein
MAVFRLGLTLEGLRELMAAEEARAALRREWRSGVEDAVRQRQILEESLSYIDRQLVLVRRRRDQIARLEEDLTTGRRRVRDRLRSLAEEPADARS